jgi:hypothetical protein
MHNMHGNLLQAAQHQHGVKRPCSALCTRAAISPYPAAGRTQVQLPHASTLCGRLHVTTVLPEAGRQKHPSGTSSRLHSSSTVSSTQGRLMLAHLPAAHTPPSNSQLRSTTDVSQQRAMQLATC